MEKQLFNIALLAMALPLVGCLIAGLLGQYLGRRLTHRLLISLLGLALVLSFYICKVMVYDAEVSSIEQALYTWATAGILHFDVAFLLDRLSVVMMTVVLFISLMVHIYTIGYMADDPGYVRFFSYVSLFTFCGSA